MADLGAIGVQSYRAEPAWTSKSFVELPHSLFDVSATGMLRKLSLGGSGCDELKVGIRQADIEGNPVPGLRMDNRSFFTIRWPVVSGVVNTFTVDVRQAQVASDTPAVIVIGDASLGVSGSTTAAASTSSWTTIGPISVTPTASGVLEVRLENRSYAEDTRCVWDSVVVSPGAPTGDFSFWFNDAPVFGFGGVAEVVGGGSASFAFVI